MSPEKTETPMSFEDIIAGVPKEMHGRPLTIGHFLSFMSLLVKANKTLQQRVTQLEQQAGKSGSGHG
ncbi:hypothetical protein [Dyella sp.]|uniref:hypothetical protein n=1 Tax=Dyella sp. TaxID=1869338 RepID=UPI003F7FF98C